MSKAGGRGLSLARRLYTSRTLGLALGLLCVGVAMYPLDPAPWVWGLMIFNGVLWPHVAYQWARRSRAAFRAEHRNLLVDAFLGGVWVAAMQFNPLPSAATLSMMAMNNVAIGGLRFMLFGAVAQILGIAIGYGVFAPAFIPETSQLQLYACLPLLCLYPLALGWICFRQANTLGRHKRELLALSRTDSLTGLLNHGAWKDQLDIEYQRCKRQHRGGAIALIDIDHFKAINDTHGHVAGDRVLRQLSRMLRQNLRATDVAGRYGGDEFCLILPDLALDHAASAMEALRDRFATLDDAQSPALSVSLSIGLAAWKPSCADATQWLDEADRALYEAKSTGRNRVICSGDHKPRQEVFDPV
jgi:diguanylate cyclase